MIQDDYFGNTYAAWQQAVRESYGSPKPPYTRQSWPTQAWSNQPIMRQPYSQELPTPRPFNSSAMPASGIQVANQMAMQQQAQQAQRQAANQSSSGENVNWTKKQHLQGPAQTGVQYVNTWEQELFQCCDDGRICMCVTCCPPCAACQISKDMDEFMCLPCCSGFCCCYPCPWLFATRTKVRTRLAIEGSMCEDCLVATCCCPCGLCQVMREVKLAKHARKM